jgi:signal transduction histidine kinase/DNA-binding response OmpR family regulator/CHASE3 domain sensor protein
MHVSVSKDQWRQTILLVFPLAFAIVVATYSWRVNTKLADDYAAVTRSYAITAGVDALMSRTTDGETAERGFVITGNETYLQPYFLFTSTIEDLYASLTALTANDPVQSAQVARLRPLLDARKEELARVILLRRETGFDAAQDTVGDGRGKDIHDRIRVLVKSISVQEWNAIVRHNTSIATATQNSARAMVLVALAVATLGFAIYLAGMLGGIRTSAAEAAKAITEAEKARLQVELARQFELLARVGEMAKMGGWELDIATQRLTFSREVYRIHDLEPTDTPDLERALGFYAPQARPVMQAAIEAACATGNSWDLELPFITTQGRHIWVRTIGVAALVDGMIVKLEGSFQDITQRKQADETLKLLTAQLVLARDRAEAGSKAKSQFLANMSHEIRTPMNAVLGMLQLLSQTELAKRQHDYVEKTRSAATSLLSILNDVLDFSKIDAGKMTLDLRSFSLDDLLRYLSVILSNTIGKKDIEAVVDVDNRLPPDIVGDSLRLQQVLTNLAGNAVKFTERGEVVLSLKLIGMSESTVDIEFSVRDTGIGIAQENMQRIFEGFSQAENSTARRFGGTGLGLAISRQLVHLMGGELKLESELGAGSRFFFTLSFQRSATQAVMKDRYATLSIQGMTRDQPLRVLVVDDNVAAREVMRSIIEGLGWQCDILDSGREALARLQRCVDLKTPYDVVFMDWNMPEMDGWKTAQRIRAAQIAQTAPIIIMISAHGREALVGRLRDEPKVLDGFLVKPVTASMMFDAVADAKAGTARINAISLRRPAITRLTGLRLLVVEDNPLNQQVAFELLSNEGARVTVASTGKAGVAAALSAAPPFDAVLMDIQMPDIDGYTATAEIRQHDSMRSLPIIAMTANVMLEDKSACLAAGMNDHVGKPIDLDTLVLTLLRHCPRISGDGATTSLRTISEALCSPPTSSVASVNQEFDKALRQIGGNKALFVNMTRMFVDTAASLPGELQRHVLGGEVDAAARLLHTLQGTAGTVGARQLADYALQIKQQLHNMDGADSPPYSVDEFDAFIRQSCNALLAYAETLKTGSYPRLEQRASLDKPAIEKVLDELELLMRDRNMRALNIFEDLRVTLGPSFDKKLMPLEQAMNDLDFPLSLERSRTLRESLV